MATNIKPTDVTGKVRAAQQKEFAEQQQEAAAKMSMVSAEAINALDETIDATKPNRQTVIVDEPTIVGNNPDGDFVEIRVVADIEHMTLGAGNNYSFKAGQKYKVEKHVAQHLKEKGYLAGVI